VGLGRRGGKTVPALDRDLAIRVDGLSKVYHPDAQRLHESPVSLSDRLLGRRTADADDVDEDDEGILDDEEASGTGDALAEEEIQTEFIWALRDVSFELPRGEVVAVVGGRGAGKTTLLNVLAGLAPPSRGYAAVRGRIWPPPTYLTTFMETAVTVRQNAFIAAKVANVGRRRVAQSMDEIYELLEVTENGQRRATGNRTRAVALAAGLVVEPDAMLLDDPAVSGGPTFEQAVVERLAALRGAGTTILLEEPDHQLIDALCDRIVWLEGSRLRAVDTKDALLPQYVAAALESTKFPQLGWRTGASAPVRSFNDTLAIRTAWAEDESGVSVDRVGPSDTLVVHVVLELAVAPAGVRCAIALTTGDDDGRVWLEQPDAATIQSAGVHDLFAYVRAEDIPAGSYTGHVEAIVSRNREDATIARAELFPIEIHGGFSSPAAAPDAGGWRRAPAEWRLSEPIRL
jgi:ABC-type polysaccharide/polyol phosphate transport system ATPase subunit